MKRSGPGLLLAPTVLVVAIALVSCGHGRKLMTITVEPATAEFGSANPNQQILFTALGTYIHPPDTRDITDKVTWKTDVPQLVSVTGGVVSPTGNGCGVANISASMNDGGNLVIGFATVTVDDTTNPNCPGGSLSRAVVTVTLAGANQGGSVVSNPAGIACPQLSCGSQFLVGESVVLTETPNSGHTFVGWSGCDSQAGTTCTVIVPAAGTNVVATFN